MAIKKVIDIDIRSDSKQADKSFKEIKKDIDSIGKSADKNLSGDNLKKVTNELKNTEKAAKSTKNRLRELEDEMADIGDVNSPQFQQIFQGFKLVRRHLLQWVELHRGQWALVNY